MMMQLLNNNGWRRTVTAVGLSLGLLTLSPVMAHHSTAMFDQSKTVEVKGVVKGWLYTNPHSFLTITVKDASGEAKDFSFEANGPGYLVRNGWNRNSVKLGDTVTVLMNPLRDGSAGGNLVEVTLPDGKKLSAAVRRPPASGAPPGTPPAPTAPAAAPGARP